MVEDVSYNNPYSRKRHFTGKSKTLYQIKNTLLDNHIKKVDRFHVKIEYHRERVLYYKKLIHWYARGGMFGGEHWYLARNNLMLHTYQIEILENDLRSYTRI